MRWSAPASGRDDEAARAELAWLYFRWTGPATLAHFRWFSAFSAAHAKAAIADLGLVDVGDGLLLPADLADEYETYAVPAQPRYALLASIDALILLRRDHRALLAPQDLDRAVPGDKPLGGLADLADHPIVDRGRIVGLWQYDTETRRVVWWAFEPAEDAAALVAAAYLGLSRPISAPAAFAT